jgi:uncharacterized protein YbjT (DUF2867 family)
MILVTGATGNIGGHVLRLLASKDIKCRVLARDPKKAEKLKGPNVEIVQGDLRKYEQVEKALKDCEKVFLATTASEGMADEENNVLKAGRKLGTLKHVVKLSALGAATESKSAVAKVQGYCEVNMRKVGLPYTILRPHAFMSNFMGQAQSIKGQGAFYGCMRDGKIASVDPADIAAVAVGALTGKGHNAKAYNITGPEAMTMAEHAEKLSAALGKAVKYVDVPPADVKKSMMAMGMSDWLAGGLLGLFEEFAANKWDKTYETVKEVGGKDPNSFEDWTREHAAAFK